MVFIEKNSENLWVMEKNQGHFQLQQPKVNERGLIRHLNCIIFSSFQMQSKQTSFTWRGIWVDYATATPRKFSLSNTVEYFTCIHYIFAHVFCATKTKKGSWFIYNQPSFSRKLNFPQRSKFFWGNLECHRNIQEKNCYHLQTQR